MKHDQSRNFLKPCGPGNHISCEDISIGVEDSHFFIALKNATGKECEYVLTLFEHLNADDLPFYIPLTSYLHQQDRTERLTQVFDFSPLRRLHHADLFRVDFGHEWEGYGTHGFSQ